MIKVMFRSDPLIWFDVVKGHIKELIEQHPGYSVSSLLQALITRELELHLVLDGDSGSILGCLITSIIQYPECKELFIIFGGGHMVNDWEDVSQQVRKYAKVNNCDHTSVFGRPGWFKRFKEFTTRYTVYCMPTGE